MVKHDGQARWPSTMVEKHGAAPARGEGVRGPETACSMTGENNRRLLEPLGYVPPAEFEAAYYQNLMGSVRDLARRVKQWRGGLMIQRWTVTAVADAATRFRRITGAIEGLPRLVRALAEHQNAAAPVAPKAKAA